MLYTCLFLVLTFPAVPYQAFIVLVFINSFLYPFLIEEERTRNIFNYQKIIFPSIKGSWYFCKKIASDITDYSDFCFLKFSVETAYSSFKE